MGGRNKIDDKREQRVSQNIKKGKKKKKKKKKKKTGKGIKWKKKGMKLFCERDVEKFEEE